MEKKECRQVSMTYVSFRHLLICRQHEAERHREGQNLSFKAFKRGGVLVNLSNSRKEPQDQKTRTQSVFQHDPSQVEVTGSSPERLLSQRSPSSLEEHEDAKDSGISAHVQTQSSALNKLSPAPGGGRQR